MNKSAILRSVLCSSLAFAAGCSSGDAPPTPGENTVALMPPAAGDGVQLRLVESDTPSGTEHQVCKNFVVPKGGWQISKVETEYRAGAHHVIIYRVGSLLISQDDKPEDINTTDTFPCGDVPGPIFYSSGTPVDSYEYPAGVGLKFDEGAVIRLELHWLNVTEKPLTADLRANLIFSKAPVMIEAGALFFYNLNIAIAPHTSQKVRMRCEIPRDINILGIVPHAHVYNTTMYARAVSATVAVDAVTATTSREFLRTEGFLDELQRPYDPAFKIKAGEIIDYGCDYTNNTDVAIVEGPQKEKSEMCLFIANYYPRVLSQAELCFLPGSGAIREEYGTMTCGEALTCQVDARAAHGFRSFEERDCWMHICKKSEPALDAFQNCIYQNCTTCVDDDECNACAQIACGEKAVACQLAGC